MPADTVDIGHRTIQACSYAIINPFQVDAGEWADLPVVPLAPVPFKAQPDLFPVLLKLDELDFATRIGLLDRMHVWESGSERPFFSALLQSEATPSRIQKHLASLMVHRHHDQVDVLRPHEPKVFRHLQWLLSAEQLDSMLGPITAWLWREPGGLWRQVRRQQVPTTVAPALRQSQWDAYARFGQLNRLIAQVHDVAPELGNDATGAAALDDLLDAAVRVHHLEDADDRRLFAEQAVRFHPGIHTHPALAARLQQAAAGHTSYARACADLDEATLHQFAHDIERQRTERIAS